MRPVEFKGANKLFHPSDNMVGVMELPIRADHDGDNPTMTSVWELEDEDIFYIAQEKMYVEVTIMGDKHPPMSLKLAKIK
jgi:hypothetical protein